MHVVGYNNVETLRFSVTRLICFRNFHRCSLCWNPD